MSGGGEEEGGGAEAGRTFGQVLLDLGQRHDPLHLVLERDSLFADLLGVRGLHDVASEGLLDVLEYDDLRVVGVGAAPSLPLSPSGQARRLVEEAVSLSNLGSMYIWWMAWH